MHTRRAPTRPGPSGQAARRLTTRLATCLALLAGALLPPSQSVAGPLDSRSVMTAAQLSYERERLAGLARKSGQLNVFGVMQGFQPVARRRAVAAGRPSGLAGAMPGVLPSAMPTRMSTLLLPGMALMPSTVRPTGMPVAIALVSSSFGMRTDPFTGSQALHEGQDFAAPLGTPIFAAASGVVIEARSHGGYGQMVDIDHGNELVTRYAHASLLLVKQGDLVRQGQQIALVGSSGRSTGAHLHFEVRTAGVAVDPVRFLGDRARSATLASAIGGP